MADVRVSLNRQSLLVAAACLLVDVCAFLSGDADRGVAWGVVLAAVVASGAALATPVRLSGVVAVGVLAAGVGGVLVLGGPAAPDVNEASAMIAAYRAGAWLRSRESGLVLAALIAGVVALGFARGHHLGGIVLIETVRVSLLPWLVGRYTTARRAYIDDLRTQAEHARRDAREAVDRAIVEDRGAIARDLHDTISHHVSAINVHAGAARMGVAALPGAAVATESLRWVESASRAAMTDLRHLLDVLHGERAGAERQPGVGGIDALLDGFRVAGVRATLRVEGEPRPLPASTDVALYRIAQEMLTNALQHGGGGPIEVLISYHDDGFTLATVNDVGRVTGREPGRARRGLTGIGNRVRIFDGVVHSGPQPDGRWRTAVSFPWPGREPADPA